jgi:hypothetical protein
MVDLNGVWTSDENVVFFCYISGYGIAGCPRVLLREKHKRIRFQ